MDAPNSFTHHARLAGVIGQDQLLQSLENVFGHEKLTRLALYGTPGAGQMLLTRTIADYLKRQFLTIEANELSTREMAAERIREAGERILVIREAHLLLGHLDSELFALTEPFPHYLWSPQMEKPKHRLRIIYFLPRWSSVNVYARRVNFENYSDDELVRIGMMHASRIGLDISQEDLKSVIKTIEYTCARGAIVTLEMVERRHPTRQPGLLTTSLDHVKKVGLQAWFDLTRPIAPLAAMPKLVKPNVEELTNNLADVSRFMALLMQFSGAEFEQLMCSLLVKLHFQVVWSSPGRDGGIDIIANSADLLSGGKYLFQCKRYQEQTKIGRPTLQEFFGAAHQHGQHPHLVFVTTSAFTTEAQQYATKVGMRLIAFTELRALIMETDLKPHSDRILS